MSTASSPDLPGQTAPRPTRNIASHAALASVGVACVLLVLKAGAAWKTGSVAMLGSLADTALDLLASLVTLYGIHIAAQPADNEHRFGHGKAEALAALFQVSLIVVSAIGIGIRAVERFSAPVAPSSPEYGIGVSVVAIVLTLALVAFQQRIVKRTGSIAIATDSLHYQSDLFLNLSVIAALVLDHWLGTSGIDPLFGLAIALWLAFGAWRAANTAIDQLMDREWPEDKRQRFLAVAAQHPELRGIHDLRTRTSGMHDFVQFHVWVDPQMSVEDAHRVMDEVEARLMEEFPGTEVLIHPDPEGHVDVHAQRRRGQ